MLCIRDTVAARHIFGIESISVVSLEANVCPAAIEAYTTVLKYT